VIISHTAESLPVVTDVISHGDVIAFRTDTFYGLGADPFNQSAIQKIKQLKGREDNKPILVLISDRDQISRLISNRSKAFDALVERFWPGPLTIIGEAVPELSSELTAGTNTVGIRLPDDDKVRALLLACGGALTGTSANQSGQPPARTAAEAEKYFGDLIDLIIDDGAARTDKPSTVVDATKDSIELIREGVIPWAEIQSALRQL
jgi:L-threonylcarbamoyladenylate synthase